MYDLLKAVVLGIVEGLTEFIPVSSTGHLIVAGHLLGFTGPTAASFEVFIQLGAVLAVAVLYRERLRALATFAPGNGFAGRRGWVLLMLTTVPALAVGAAGHGFITNQLFTPTTVALGWGLGGVAILLAERFRPPVTRACLDELRWRDALAIGLFQCLSLWPGVSRAGATIIGGLLIGVGRRTAAEYSFLVAIPIILAATVFDLGASRNDLSAADIPLFATGFVVSFVFAWIAVKLFLRLLSVATLKPFGWYRIVVALVLLVAIAAGWLDGGFGS